jgi:hypothetical protein
MNVESFFCYKYIFMFAARTFAQSSRSDPCDSKSGHIFQNPDQVPVPLIM